MAKLFQIGVIYPHEARSGIGHMACTLGGVNYESRGGRGCLKGTAARGATHPLFRHRFRLELTDAQALCAKQYADRCVGLPYVWGGVPVRPVGGDCSGLQSGVYCTALGLRVERLFSTGTWNGWYRTHGFATDDRVPAIPDFGAADRPWPGYAIEKGSPKAGHIKWIQARLNFAAHNHHPVLDGKALDVDGDFGPLTLKVVVAFQRGHGLQGLGMVGPKTWTLLNAVR
jgi:Putative peptidoglycan binding domain